MEASTTELRTLPCVPAKVPPSSAHVNLVGAPAKSSVPAAAKLGPPPLIACITACNEAHEELVYCLETFHGRCPADVNLDAIYVLLDGCPDEDMQAENQTFQDLVCIMGLDVPNDGTSAIHEGGCRVYLGKAGDVPARLYVKGRGDFQRSKRRSVIAFYDILGERIASGKSQEPLAVLHMDADTGSAEPGGDNSKSSFGLENVAKLVRIMQDNDNLGALATQVRILHRTKNMLALMQSFDCNTTYVGLNGGTSLVGRSVACLGMAVMYRYRALHVSRVKGVLSPMAAFSRVADRNIVDHVNLDMNEDQGMTTFIMRAGHETKTSLVTRFCTFAPQDLAELLGQRRRWQAGFFVGLPSQVFGLPSPHLQLPRLRWLTASLVMIMYANMLLMPGTLGFGLASMFEQAYIGLVPLWRTLFDGVISDWADCDERRVSDAVEGEEATSFVEQHGPAGCGGIDMLGHDISGRMFRQAVFASCTWAFWIAFIASTMGQAPKKIRGRCQFFFTVACVVTVAVVVAAALLSHTGQVFLAIMVSWNCAVGLSLTYDAREWRHRLQEVLPYCVYVCAIQPMITMYAVANIDSALWGTRSIGEVKTTSASTDTETVANMDKAVPVTSSRGGGHDGNGGTRKKRGHLGNALAASTVAPIDEEEAVPLMHDGSDAVVVSASGSDREESETEAELGTGGKRGGGGHEKRGAMSLRTWKFIILALWVLVNVGVTLAFVLWLLNEADALCFFSQLPALVGLVVAARLEMRLQRRSALPPPPPFADAVAERSVSPRKDEQYVKP